MDWRESKSWDNHLDSMVTHTDEDRYGRAWLEGRAMPKHTGVIDRTPYNYSKYPLTEDDIMQEDHD